MKKFIFVVFLSALAAVSSFAQSSEEAKQTKPKTITISESQKAPTAPVKAKRGPVFRPTKDQIKQVQAMLKERSFYNGEASGSYNTETRAGIRKFQKENGLRETGTLNRATLEKMGVALTDAQKAIPVSENSFASADEKPEKAERSGPSDSEAKPKKAAIFRATADQIKEAQRTLKAKSLYEGEETGKLDKATRASLKKYQEANSLKSTGTLNQATLESMGIALTEKQRGSSTEQK